MKKIFNISLSFFIIIFFYIISNEYISDKNKIKVKKNRLNIERTLPSKTSDLIVLQNDTNNIIEYNSGFNSKINKKPKRNFWELIKVK
jgi:hypothetical protein|tara:strand:+ start:903 stop:1166 length:264 start_codon:yes stop_codon:yes gene_type:complete